MVKCLRCPKQPEVHKDYGDSRKSPKKVRNISGYNHIKPKLQDVQLFLFEKRLPNISFLLSFCTFQR